MVRKHSVDYRDLTDLLLKVAGAVIIAYSIVNIPAYVSYYFTLQEGSLWTFIGISVLPMLIPLIVGLVLLLFPAKLSNRIIKGPGRTGAAVIDVKALEQIAFAVLGLYLLFRVVSDLVYHLTSIWLAYSRGNLARYNTGADHPLALLAATIAELVFALYLLLGSGGLVRLLERLRTAGR